MLNVKLPNGHLTWPSRAQASLNTQHSTLNIPRKDEFSSIYSKEII